MINTLLRFVLSRPLSSALFALFVVSNAGWAIDSWNTNRELRRAKETQSDLILDVARADSVVHRVGERNDELLAGIAQMSEHMGRLARNLDATGSENARLTELLARANSELSDTGTVHFARDTVERQCRDCLMPGDSVTGRLQDSVFVMDWTFIPLDSLRARITADIRARMVSVELPDDRIAVFAESTTPNVEIVVERFEFTPPKAPDPGWDWSSGFWGVVIGIPLGVIGWEVIR